MDIDQLRAFVLLAEAGRFGAAAERLHITQPALTKRLRALEGRFGGRLFTRGRNGAAPTPLGEFLLPEAKRIVAAADQLLAEGRAAAKGEAGLLRIGFGLSSIDAAPRLVAAWRRAHPGVQVALNDHSSAEQRQRLLDGRLDLGFLRMDFAQGEALEARPLFEDRLALALPQDFAAGVEVDFDRLNAFGFILLTPERGPGLAAQIESWRRAAGVDLRVIQRAEDLQTVLALVSAGAGVSIIPGRGGRLMPEGLRLQPLEGEAARWSIGLAWNPGREHLARDAFVVHGVC